MIDIEVRLPEAKFVSQFPKEITESKYYITTKDQFSDLVDSWPINETTTMYHYSAGCLKASVLCSIDDSSPIIITSELGNEFMMSNIIKEKRYVIKDDAIYDYIESTRKGVISSLSSTFKGIRFIYK